MKNPITGKDDDSRPSLYSLSTTREATITLELKEMKGILTRILGKIITRILGKIITRILGKIITIEARL